MWQSLGAGCTLAVGGRNVLKHHAIFSEGGLQSGHFSVLETKGEELEREFFIPFSLLWWQRRLPAPTLQSPTVVH